MIYTDLVQYNFNVIVPKFSISVPEINIELTNFDQKALVSIMKNIYELEPVFSSKNNKNTFLSYYFKHYLTRFINN